MKTVPAILVLATAVTALLAAQPDKTPEAKLKIERVALFKNGLGYFTSAATLPDHATTVTFGQLPIPALGTFWVGYPADLKVRGLFTRMETVGEPSSARTLAQLLAANVGRQLVLNARSTSALTGTVVAVTRADPPEPPNPYVMDTQRDPNRGDPYSGWQLVTIRTERGTVTLNAGSISAVDFEGDNMLTTTTVVSKRPSIRIELEKPASGQEVDISYLTHGITWAPSYLIDLSDAKKARLSAKAVVINEVTDLDGVHMDLVTGFPNIQFADVSGPEAMSQNLATFLAGLQQSQGEGRDGRRGYLIQQQGMANNGWAYAGEPVNSVAPSYSTARQGTVAEDLFFYPVDKLTLHRGETACLPLFTAELPYEHIYTWKIPDFLDNYERYVYAPEPRQNEPPATEEVWHACRLTNTTKMPWTTAPAEFVTDGQFTGQDICYYTPAGAEATIRINRAMSIAAEQAELETARTRNATNFSGTSYDLVKVTGELKIRNRLDKAVKMEVTKDLSGEIREITPEAKDIPTAKGLRRVNPRHTLIWKIELKPAEEQALSYAYQVYVRN